MVCPVLCVQQNDTEQVQTGPSYVVVVAIDFGTTSSGYAYAFTKEPECIHTMRYSSTAMQTFTGEGVGVGWISINADGVKQLQDISRRKWFGLDFKIMITHKSK